MDGIIPVGCLLYCILRVAALNEDGSSVLGSTGSIGESTLDVIRMHPDKFQGRRDCLRVSTTGFLNTRLKNSA
ncbi:MAG: hypothetical protein MZU95_15415 [Desulfomicrobium escambiense]|nr:hypothetical protein [Desulfomicrobium escambiense]